MNSEDIKQNFSDEEEEILNVDEVAEVVEFDAADMDQDSSDDDVEDPNVNASLQDDSIQCFSDHTDSVYCVSVHPSLPLCATGGGDDMCRIWNMETAESLNISGSEQHNSDSISAVSFSHDGKYLAAGCMDGKVTIFEIADAHNASLIHVFEDSSEIMWLNWHPSSYFLIAGSTDGIGFMWRVDKLVLASTLSGGHIDNISFGQFTPSGKNIVTAGEEGHLCKWQVAEGVCNIMKKWSPEDKRWHQAPITSLAIDDHSVIALTGDQAGRICMVNLAKGDFIKSYDIYEDSIESLAINMELGLVASSSVDGQILFHDLEHDLIVRGRFRHEGAVIKLAWLPHRPILLSCSSDGTLGLWHGKAFKKIKQLHGHSDAILDFATTKDGLFCATAGDDNLSLIFSLELD